LDLTFFGLTSSSAAQARFALFSNIHQIVFHGKGGYDYHTVYNMPIWLRKFTFSEIKKYYDEENKSQQNSVGNNQNVAINTDGTVADRSLFNNVPSSPGTSPRKPASYK
jgi:hypothetical protein